MSIDKSIKVLVADDMPAMRVMVDRMLRDIGFSDIQLFENGKDAFDDVLKMDDVSTPYGLIVSDWNMPVLNGLNFLKKVRATGTCKTIPFLMITTISDKAKVIEALNHGVSHYVMKPLTLDDLKVKIEKIVN